MTNQQIKEKFIEFLEYLNIEENKIPSQSSKVLFKDGSKMGYYFNNNEVRIRRWLKGNEVEKYPIAAKKLTIRITYLSRSREKFTNNVLIKRNDCIISNEKKLTKKN